MNNALIIAVDRVGRLKIARWPDAPATGPARSGISTEKASDKHESMGCAVLTQRPKRRSIQGLKTKCYREV